MKKIFLVFIFLIGCQTTSDIVAFKKLQKNMEKGEVLEIIGTPIRKERKYQRDWWYYSFYEGENKFERMVVFDSGKLIYAGRVTTKKGTAAEDIDSLNERTNELAPIEQIKAEEQ